MLSTITTAATVVFSGIFSSLVCVCRLCAQFSNVGTHTGRSSSSIIYFAGFAKKYRSDFGASLFYSFE